jgi:hypothetical protein
MSNTSKIATLLEYVARGVASHDRENPAHHTWGIGMAHFDIERLGLEEGEELLPGIVLQADGGGTGGFRILCDGLHGQGAQEEEAEVVEAVSEHEIVQPAHAPGPARPLRPPV